MASVPGCGIPSEQGFPKRRISQLMVTWKSAISPDDVQTASGCVQFRTAWSNGNAGRFIEHPLQFLLEFLSRSSRLLVISLWWGIFGKWGASVPQWWIRWLNNLLKIHSYSTQDCKGSVKSWKSEHYKVETTRPPRTHCLSSRSLPSRLVLTICHGSVNRSKLLAPWQQPNWQLRTPRCRSCLQKK